MKIQFKSLMAVLVATSALLSGASVFAEEYNDADVVAKDITIVGSLQQVVAIGGETTGCQLTTSTGVKIEINLGKTGVGCVPGWSIAATGDYVVVHGVETGGRKVFLAKSAKRVMTAN